MPFFQEWWKIAETVPSTLYSLGKSSKKQIFYGQADRKRSPPRTHPFCDFLVCILPKSMIIYVLKQEQEIKSISLGGKVGLL